MFPQSVYNQFIQLLTEKSLLQNAKILFPALFQELEVQKSKNTCNPDKVKQIILNIKTTHSRLVAPYAEAFKYLDENFKAAIGVHSQPLVGSSTQVQPQPMVSVQNTPAPSMRVVQQPILTTVPQSTQVVRQPILTTVPQSPSSTFNYFQIGFEHAKDWKDIEVTDLPTDTSGRYELTQNDKYVEGPKGAAAAKVLLDKKCSSGKATECPEYWGYYGRMVMKGMKSLQNKKFGRCHSCAAAAVYTLVMDPRYDFLDIHVCGNADYDHHFVYIGTREELNKGQGYVIDIWQANVSKQLGGKELPYVWEVSKYRYLTKGWKYFCQIYTEQRSTLRQYISQDNV